MIPLALRIPTFLRGYYEMRLHAILLFNPMALKVITGIDITPVILINYYYWFTPR